MTLQAKVKIKRWSLGSKKVAPSIYWKIFHFSCRRSLTFEDEIWFILPNIIDTKLNQGDHRRFTVQKWTIWMCQIEREKTHVCPIVSCFFFPQKIKCRFHNIRRWILLVAESTMNESFTTQRTTFTFNVSSTWIWIFVNFFRFHSFKHRNGTTPQTVESVWTLVPRLVAQFNLLTWIGLAH